MPDQPADRGQAAEEQLARPRTRGECRNGPRPCPWVSCRHHLALDVQGRSVRERLDPEALDQAAETCALDVAERPHAPRGPELADLLGISRQRVSQLTLQAITRVGVIPLSALIRQTAR